jgi:hypothetical protein
MQQQVALSRNGEPIQVPVPDNFMGERSSESPVLMLTTQFHPFTMAEIELIESFIKTLPYTQSLSRGGVMLSEDDPLLLENHDFLDNLESLESLPKTRFVKGGGENSVFARVLLIRESGFMGNGKPALTD